MGNVNTGLADEKVSECVKEVVCCSSDHTQMDQDDGSCAICLVYFIKHVPVKDTLITITTHSTMAPEICWTLLLLTDGCVRSPTGGLQRQGGAGNTQVQARLPRRLHQEVAADEELVPGVQSGRGLVGRDTPDEEEEEQATVALDPIHF
jgi:hypothetical protein